MPPFADDDTPEHASCNPQLQLGALPCDAWHHYYHYQSSAQYLHLAEALRLLGRSDDALAALGRALFQDHFNPVALRARECLAAGREEFLPLSDYTLHPASDHAFLASTGRADDAATELHDKAVFVIKQQDNAAAMHYLTAALALSPHHANSFFTRGRLHLAAGRPEAALADLQEAIRLSHAEHDAYHAQASEAHRERALAFLAQGELDLAINDFTKALDLDRGNRLAAQQLEETRARRLA